MLCTQVFSFVVLILETFTLGESLDDFSLSLGPIFLANIMWRVSVERKYSELCLATMVN